MESADVPPPLRSVLINLYSSVATPHDLRSRPPFVLLRRLAYTEKTYERRASASAVSAVLDARGKLYFKLKCLWFSVIWTKAARALIWTFHLEPVCVRASVPAHTFVRSCVHACTSVSSPMCDLHNSQADACQILSTPSSPSHKFTWRGATPLLISFPWSVWIVTVWASL